MNIQGIADLYRSTPHTPQHPSYAVFARDTLRQWDSLIADGWSFESSDSQPYPDSASMFRALEDKHLVVFRGGSKFAPEHPLSVMHPSGWSVNDIFRAVHDILGHGLTRAPFETFDGETQAYFNHARVYSPEAIPALYSETMGQLCHYYAGYGFTDIQRAVIIPVEL